MLSFFPILINFYSCDPGYYMLISNRSGQDTEIQVKAFSDNIAFYESKNNMFKTGKLVRKDSLDFNKGKYYKQLLLPAGQTLKINGIGFAFPSGESIIVKTDTIDATTFQSKGGFFDEVRWAYSIKAEEKK